MFKVKVLTIGKCKETWLFEALKEYEKRLKGRATFEWLIAKDDEQLIEWAQGKTLIALDPKGKLFTSEEWSKKMTALGAKATFCIGGAKGLPQEIVKQAVMLWSLSPLTFTHQMTRLILMEQIYRAIEIERGSQYHK